MVGPACYTYPEAYYFHIRRLIVGLQALFGKCGRKYTKNAIICRDKEKGKEMFIILSGQVKIYKQGPPPHYKVNTIATLSAGEFFGEMSLLEDLPRYANAQAITEVNVLVIDIETLKMIVKTQPDFAVKIMQKLSKRIRKLDDMIIFNK